MGAPVVIGVAGGSRDREVTSALLRTVLDGPEPYRRSGIIGARELFDGAEWARRPDLQLELRRIEEHMQHARTSGLSYLIVELDEATERGTSRVELLCTVGAGDTGTARTAQRSLSFSARGAIADIGASRAETHYGYLQFVAHTPDWTDRLVIPATGLFNLGPALGAVASAVLLGINSDQLIMGLLNAKVPGHGELLSTPDRRVFALVEESRARRDADRLVNAARKDYGSFNIEVVHGAGNVAAAAARAYASREGGRTLLVLLGDSSDSLEDAFQTAVRAHARPS